MKALASFIMRSRTNALLMVVLFSALTLVLPPLGPVFTYLVTASIALVTLRNGISEGLLGWVICSAVFTLAALAGLGGKDMVTLWVLGISAIVLVISLVLRSTRSLSTTVGSAGLIAAILVVIAHLVLTDSVAWWHEVLTKMFAPLMEQADAETSTQLQSYIDLISRQMTGIFAVAFLVNALIGLFVARWWQAMLYNPGGFKQEFHQLRLAKVIGIITLVLALLSIVKLGFVSQLANDLLSIALALYVFQGLAVAHAVVAIKKLHTAFLVGLYVIMILESKLVAVLGYIDSWVDLRKRVTRPDATA